MGGGAPRRRERRRVARRAALLQAVWNYETFQGVGFAWSLLPALDRLYPDRNERARRVSAYLESFNSNPYLGSIGMGVALRLEEEIARAGAGPAAAGGAQRLTRLLRTLGGSLGAVGDAFFWGGWRPALGLAAAVAAILAPSPWPALAFLVAFNGLAQTVRWRGVRVGFTSGAGVARVLHDPFWRRGGAVAVALGAVAAGVAVGAGYAGWIARDGGVMGAAVFSLLVALLWLAGPRPGPRRLPAGAAFLVVVILLSALFHLRPGVFAW